MEKNYKLIIGYDGTRYFGWEHQPGKDTIQGKLEDVLNYLAGACFDHRSRQDGCGRARPGNGS